MVYGYCRISTPKQSLTRQVQNISKFCPKATIITEIWTGTKQNRPKWQELFKRLRPRDTVIFDSVSRMSRNADEGIKEYMDLFDRNVTLVFLKERHIDTERYQKALDNSNIELTDNKIANEFLKATMNVLKMLAADQIQCAFNQSAKEVDDLKARTAEGLRGAKEKGKRIGQAQGAKLTVKKAAPAKEVILKHSKSFGGTLNNKECARLANISRNTFYLYKRQLKAELSEKEQRTTATREETP